MSTNERLKFSSFFNHKDVPAQKIAIKLSKFELFFLKNFKFTLISIAKKSCPNKCLITKTNVTCVTSSIGEENNEINLLQTFSKTVIKTSETTRYITILFTISTLEKKTTKLVKKSIVSEKSIIDSYKTYIIRFV